MMFWDAFRAKDVDISLARMIKITNPKRKDL
jgi:hypothetical protein